MTDESPRGSRDRRGAAGRTTSTRRSGARQVPRGRANPLLTGASAATSGRSRRTADPASTRTGTSTTAVPDPVEQAKPEEPGAPHGVVCTVGMCPICALVTALGDARPELTEHLLLAGRELLLAIRSLIDARLQADEPSPGGGLERIPIE